MVSSYLKSRMSKDVNPDGILHSLICSVKKALFGTSNVASHHLRLAFAKALITAEACLRTFIASTSMHRGYAHEDRPPERIVNS